MPDKFKAKVHRTKAISKKKPEANPVKKQSLYQRRKKKDEDKKRTYYPEIGDSCYRYSREAKQTFFKDQIRKFHFHITIPLLE